MYFDNCITLDAAKNKYRILSKLVHPDKGGNLEIQQEVNQSFHDWIERFADEPPEGSTLRFDPWMEKLDMILNWAQLPENSDFRCRFVQSLKDQYLRKGWLSDKQMESIDGIIDSYDIGA